MKAFWFHGLLFLGVCALLTSCSGGPGQGADAAAPAGAEGELLLNLCPEEGCRVEVTAAERQGEELLLSLQANFAPDLARNHIHIYWDNFSAEQVGSDSPARFGVRQGEWAEVERTSFATSGRVSVSARGESMMICATAADLDHRVINPRQSDCFEVGELVR